jgi:hypothetical protein
MSSQELPFYNTFNSAFWLALAGLLFGFGGVCFKACYASKCKQFSVCCGLIKVDRDIEAEEDIDLHTPKSSKEESKL